MSEEKEEVVKVGAFVASLKRNNTKIREDRAQAISEDVELIYKRAVEDIQVEIRALERDRDNMLDMSPDNAFSIIKADSVDAPEFTKKDLEIGVKLRNLEIKQDIAKKRYAFLFGGK